MSQRHKFRPSMLAPLEDRTALSHGGAVGAMAALGNLGAALSARVSGVFVTRLPMDFGGGQQAYLVGNTRVPRIGGVVLNGALSSNGSLPPPDSNTQGAFVITARSGVGSLTAIVNGPSTDLAPRTVTRTHLNFTVTSATGAFTPEIGQQGTADLAMVTRGRPRGGLARGNFAMIVTVTSPTPLPLS